MDRGALVFMIEHEHHECCQADIEEQKFLERCRQMLTEAGFHPLNTEPLPRAKPKPQPTHRLEFGQYTKQYYVVPIVPQHERGDQR